MARKKTNRKTKRKAKLQRRSWWRGLGLLLLKAPVRYFLVAVVISGVLFWQWTALVSWFNNAADGIWRVFGWGLFIAAGAIGLKAEKGVVAVDDTVIPMRSRLYIPGYGFAIAGDRGSAIKGMRIDLCFATYAEAINFGRQPVKVYRLD